MRPRDAFLVAAAGAVPVTFWLAGQLAAVPFPATAELAARAVRVLWLLQGLGIAAAIPLLADRGPLPPQLGAGVLLAALPWPLMTLAVLAGAISWTAAATAAGAGLGAVVVVTTASVLGLRQVPAAALEQPARFLVACLLGLLWWSAPHPWLHWLATL